MLALRSGGEEFYVFRENVHIGPRFAVLCGVGADTSLPDHAYPFPFGKIPGAVVTQLAPGVDAEEIKPFSQRLAEKVCSENELREIEKSPDKAREFTKIWTRKESFIKMTGEGFSHGLKEADTTTKKFFSEERDGLFISVCESE